MLETFFKDVPASLLALRIEDLLDVLIVAYIFYKFSGLLRETRAGTLIKGIILVLIFAWISNILQLNTINYLLRNLMQFGIMALIVVFQPELRRTLEKVGKTNFSSLFASETSDVEALATNISAAASAMSSRRIGALIVLERDVKISDIIRTGTEIDAKVSSELLVNIFIPNTPLHDGALIIRENRILAAGCILPLTQNEALSQEFGTRHRAALGLSESSDAAVIVVSEETGKISFTKDGNMSRNFTEEALKKMIIKTLSPDSEKKNESALARWKERFKWKK